jgi:hypothetical protein
VFPGAQTEHTITLEAVRTTRIRPRGPNGQPLSGVELAISYGKKGTDQTMDGQTTEQPEETRGLDCLDCPSVNTRNAVESVSSSRECSP